MKKKILIIDDAKEIRETTTMALEFEGHEVMTAIHGQDALDILNKLSEEHLPDMILLDLMMPVMDGYSFLKQMKSMSSLRKIPVVVMTAKDVPGFSSDLQPDFCLRKPVSLDLLLDAVKKYSSSKK